MGCFGRDECKNHTESLIDQIKDDVPGRVYHYTKAVSFEGIIKRKEIWMGNALFVNDKEELRASLEANIFQDCEFNNSEFNEFKNKSKILKPKDIEDYYLGCFSKDCNSLYQFRSYGSYCIGFDATKLKKKNFNLFKCVYEQKPIKDWIIDKDKLPGWKDDRFNCEEGKEFKEAAFSWVKFGRQVKLKNKHYESEEEIRLVALSSSLSSRNRWPNSPEMFCEQPAICFRHSGFFNVPVPYVKFFIPKKPIPIEDLENMVKDKSQMEAKQIITEMNSKQEKELLPIVTVAIGPMQNQEEVAFATKIFLCENGYDKVEVIRSDIPFRGK